VNPADRLRSILEARDDVRLAYLFGSAARGQERAASDVDLAVLFERLPDARDLDLLATSLEAAAGRPVDLVVLDTAPPLLTRQVVATGRVLVCRDEEERARFEARAASRYLDTAHLRQVQHAYLRERADAHRARSS